MDQVLTDANLINHVFWCIDGNHLPTIFHALRNWCVVNRTFCGACQGDLSKAAEAVLQRVFEKEFKRYGAALAPVFEQHNASFSERVWALLTVRRHFPGKFDRKATTARCRFLSDMSTQYKLAKRRLRNQGVWPVPTLFEWIKPEWQNLSQFKRAVYDLSFQVDQREFDRINGVANAFMAQAAQEALGWGVVLVQQQ
jgi:hypothetical protein